MSENTGLPIDKMPKELLQSMVGIVLEHIMFKEFHGVAFISQERLTKTFQEYTNTELELAMTALGKAPSEFVEYFFHETFEYIETKKRVGFLRQDAVDQPLQVFGHSRFSEGNALTVTKQLSIEASKSENSPRLKITDASEQKQEHDEPISTITSDADDSYISAIEVQPPTPTPKRNEIDEVSTLIDMAAINLNNANYVLADDPEFFGASSSSTVHGNANNDQNVDCTSNVTSDVPNAENNGKKYFERLLDQQFENQFSIHKEFFDTQLGAVYLSTNSTTAAETPKPEQDDLMQNDVVENIEARASLPVAIATEQPVLPHPKLAEINEPIDGNIASFLNLAIPLTSTPSEEPAIANMCQSSGTPAEAVKVSPTETTVIDSSLCVAKADEGPDEKSTENVEPKFVPSPEPTVEDSIFPNQTSVFVPELSDAEMLQLINQAVNGGTITSGVSETAAYHLEQGEFVQNFEAINRVRLGIASSVPPVDLSPTLNLWKVRCPSFAELILFYQYMYRFIKDLAKSHCTQRRHMRHLSLTLCRREEAFKKLYSHVTNLDMMMRLKFLVPLKGFDDIVYGINPEILQLTMYPLARGMPSDLMHLVKDGGVKICDIKKAFTGNTTQVEKDLLDTLNSRPDLFVLSAPVGSEVKYDDLVVSKNENVPFCFVVFNYELADVKMSITNLHLAAELNGHTINRYSQFTC